MYQKTSVVTRSDKLPFSNLMHIHIPIQKIHVHTDIYIYTPHNIYIYITLVSYHIMFSHTHVCMYDMCVIVFSGRKAAAIQAGDRGWGPPTQHHPHGAVDGSWGWPWLNGWYVWYWRVTMLTKQIEYHQLWWFDECMMNLCPICAFHAHLGSFQQL
jgi:hypothetical protein